MAFVAFLPALVVAVVLVVAFLILAWVLAAFRDAGFTVGEALLIVLFAPFVAAWNFAVYTEGNLTIAVNVGGCLVPLIVAARVIAHDRVPLWKAAVAAAVVAAIVYPLSEFVPGVGVRAPAILLVALAALVGLVLAFRNWKSAPLIAYVGGTVGVLAGADLVRIPQILSIQPGEPTALSIGGAGTLDGIFLVGLGAVFLQLLLFAVVDRR